MIYSATHFTGLTGTMLTIWYTLRTHVAKTTCHHHSWWQTRTDNVHKAKCTKKICTPVWQPVNPNFAIINASREGLTRLLLCWVNSNYRMSILFHHRGEHAVPEQFHTKKVDWTKFVTTATGETYVGWKWITPVDPLSNPDVTHLWHPYDPHAVVF